MFFYNKNKRTKMKKKYSYDYTYITVAVPNDFLKEFNEIRDKEGIPRSVIIRELIKKFVINYKKTGKIF